MKVKRTVSLFIVVISLFTLCFSGCGTEIKNESIPQCDIPMQMVTQSTKTGYVDFVFQLPKDWQTEALPNFSVRAYQSESNEINFTNFAAKRAYTITIDNYYKPDYFVLKFDSNLKQLYADLFSGNTDIYRNHLNEHVAFANECLEADKTYQMQEANTTEQSDLSQEAVSNSDENYITDFDCRFLQGDNSKIAVVTFTYMYDNEFYHAINCIREDIPYMVSGDFNDMLEVSAGDIALAVANSLQVTEHFTLDENGQIQPE